MTSENTLISKTYYQKFMIDNEFKNPIESLAELYLSAQKNEYSNLTEIRFSQGELYFHYKDFETAIFKWETIHDDLELWAKKNIADAYFELGNLTSAEDTYKSIETEHVSLKTEVTLKLLSIYIEQGRLEESTTVIKNIVAINPDYPNVTNIARSFFEDYKDWNNALELAVNEAIRTQSLEWFEAIKLYIDYGIAKSIEPDYFSKVLVTLFEIDEFFFEELAVALWENYKHRELYFSWITVFNNLFIDLEGSRSKGWDELSDLYQETYFDLMKGDYFVKDLSEIFPALLTNWLKITDSSNCFVASAAVISWSEVFPSSISVPVLNKAEKMIAHPNGFDNSLNHTLQLFESISVWAKNNGVDLGHKINWIVEELADTNVNHLFIAGTTGNEKSSFINSVLGGNVVSPSSCSFVMFKHADVTTISEITDIDIRTGLTLSDFHGISEVRRQEPIIDFRLPSNFLDKCKLAIIDTPIYKGNKVWKELFKYLPLADALLYIINVDSPLTENEYATVLQLKKYAPNLSIHFLINANGHSEDKKEIIETTKSKLRIEFPDSKMIVCSSSLQNREQQDDISLFIKNITRNNIHEVRPKNILQFIRKIIEDLFEKRVELENGLEQSINWNQMVVSKLTGAINQLSDLENEKIHTLKNSFIMIKEEIKGDLVRTIPTLLRECSQFIKEDCDFSTVHIDLNTVMNDAIRNYMQDTIRPKFSRCLDEWVQLAKDEFSESQLYLEEMCEGFRTLYEKENLSLKCDFQVFQDWARDAERMSSIIEIEDLNIFNGIKPSLILLKGSGKLFEYLPANKLIIYKAYKRYIENENYENVAATIINRFMMQFELFEKTLERDIKRFYKEPYEELASAIEEGNINIEVDKDSLNNLKTNPDMFFDPLTLFDIRLRQYELILNIGIDVPTSKVSK
ncbi:GTP-binding protein [Bacillus sp. Marseille-P3661]|uniref:GTP-binding protein n=1 Tax=Bacillus sp. Marseille-P3661 TaxID=1936234 RepID=UPI000C86634A|nr:GTP-binding protein [Bacillus sp. Marseille-P3661]